MVLAYNQVFERVNRSASLSFADGMQRLQFHAMATNCRVSFSAVSDRRAKLFAKEVLHYISEFEARYSRFIPESLIGQINSMAGIDWMDVDEETDQLFSLCQDLFFFTQGAFDPTTLPIIKLWNWKTNPPIIPTDDAVTRALERVGWLKVRRRTGAIFLPEKGMGIDLGGIGKEYAVDRTLQLALQHGIENVLVDYGQDIRVHGLPPNKPAWHIGLEDPENPGSCRTGLAVNDAAVASSGDYLRRFIWKGRKYGHILDPRTGYPVSNRCHVVNVIAPTCSVAGILATTAFIMGPEEGLALIDAYYAAEGSICTETKNFETRNFHEFVTS